MKKWSIPVLIAIVALLMPMSTAIVSAQDELSISKSADPTSAAVGDNITYTYTITNNSDNFTISNISLVDDKLGAIDLAGQTSLGPGGTITAAAIYTAAQGDLPGPIENTATTSGTDPDGNPVSASATASVELTSPPSDEVPAIEVTKSADKTTASPSENITYTYTVTNTGNVVVDNVTLTDDKLGELMSGITLAPGESVTTTAIYEVKNCDFWKFKPITNIATVTAIGPDDEQISAKSQLVSVFPHKAGMFKYMILWLSGVPGKGIKKAPGLQKPFNPKSRAAEHAGKKDKPRTPEQLQIQERVENQGTEQQLQIQLEMENHAGSVQATQGDVEAKPWKWQLMKNCNTDNQTWEYDEPKGKCNKPDKGKTGK